MSKPTKRRSVGRLVSVAALVAAAPAMAPQLLAFPYSARSGSNEVWSETPLPQTALDRVIARAAMLETASPLAKPPEARHIFLTQGGWRWKWLALGCADCLALTRAINEAVIVNRNDLTRDRLGFVVPPAHARSLSGVIAHETCHGMERRHFGVAVEVTVPSWLFEGYCDYVARESSLSDAAVRQLAAQHWDHPALAYYYGRRRVAAALAANGGNVDALFAKPQ